MRSLNGITNDRVNNNNYPLKNKIKEKFLHFSCSFFIGDFPQFNVQQQKVKKKRNERNERSERKNKSKPKR